MGIWQAVWLICLGFSVGSSGVVRSKRIRQFPHDDSGKSPSTTTSTPSDDGEEPPPQIPCAHRNQCGRYASLPFHARNCFCDSSCRAYGDCCRDYDPKEAHGPGTDAGPVIPHSVRGIVSCRRVEEIDTSYEMYIVDSCPKGFKDRFIVDKCQNELTPGLFYRLPVTGRTSGVLYRNVYCATCAGEPDVIFWEMAHRCSEADWSSNGALRNIKTAEEFRRLTNHLRCPVEMIAPMGKRARKCKSNVDRCPRKWRDDRVASKCKSYTAYVYHGLQVFKNKHCAKCNNIDEAVVQCDDTRTPWPDFDSRLNEGDDTSKETTPSSVYIVLDTNTGSGIIRRTLHSTREQMEGRPGEGEDSVVVELGRCSEGSVYDVFADTCRFTGCRDGKCLAGAAVNLTTTVSPSASETTETETVDGNTEKVTAAIATPAMTASTIAITSTTMLRPTATTRRTFLKSNKDLETSSSSTSTTTTSTTATTATTRDRTTYNKTTKTYKLTETTTRDKSRKSKSKTTFKSTTRMRPTSTKIVTTPTTTFTTTTAMPTTTATTTPTNVPTTPTSSPTTATSSASTETSTTTAVQTTTATTAASTISTTYTTRTASTSSSTTAATRRAAFVLMVPIPTVGSSPMRQTEATAKSVDDFMKVTRSMRGRQMEANPKDVRLLTPSTPATTSTGSPVTSLPESLNGNVEGEMELSGGEPAGDGENNSDRSRNCSDILVMFQFDRLQSLASFVGTLTSLISLLVSFVTILVLPSMRQTVRGKVLLSLILSLFVAQLLYLMALPSNNSFASRAVCYWTGTVLHYCVLAVFFWVSVLAIDTALNIMGKQRELETCERWGRVFGYSLYAWLTPAVIVAACLTAEALEADRLLIRPCYGRMVCWVTGRFALLLTVALPAGVLTLVSLFLYFLSASHMCVNVTYKDLKTKRSRIPDGRRLAISVCLTLIVALTWVSGFVATFSGLDPIWWVFIGFSSAQGSFICVGFFCTRKIFQRLKDRGQSGGKESSLAATTWSYQKDRGPASTVDRTPGNNRSPGAENEIVLHETSM